MIPLPRDTDRQLIERAAAAGMITLDEESSEEPAKGFSADEAIAAIRERQGLRELAIDTELNEMLKGDNDTQPGDA